MREYVDPDVRSRLPGACAGLAVLGALLLSGAIIRGGLPLGVFVVLIVSGLGAALIWRMSRVAVVLGADTVIVRNLVRDFVFTWDEVVAVENRRHGRGRSGGLCFVMPWGRLDCQAFPDRPGDDLESRPALQEVLEQAQDLLDAWRARGADQQP